MSIASNQRDAGAAIFGSVVSLLLTVAFAVSAGRAAGAIPQYRRQPAWCQELLTRVEKRK